MENDKIQFIIDNLQENLEIEVKNWLNGLAEKADQEKLAKEIIALGNNGGGYVFIGFDDNGADFPEVVPKADEFDAFTQDKIASIVDRYVTPPCQCRVEFYRRSGCEQYHPVIIVPGEHRTPLWAQRGSADNTLENGKIYVRRPGGKSEVARNQDDWEKLIDRLVQARQSDMLVAVREILNPSSRVLPAERSSIEEWDIASYGLWSELVSAFPENDPRRLEHGHWTVSFAIQPFTVGSLGELNTVIDQKMPKYSGWPPFTYLHRDPIRPEARGDVIQAYIGNTRDGESPIDRADTSDFWRVSKDGQGFFLRPMQEDFSRYYNTARTSAVDTYFDWTLPIYRMTELYKYIEALGEIFGGHDTSFQLLLRYYKTSGRKLKQHSWDYSLIEGGECKVDALESRIEASISEIQLGIEELIFSILCPIYEQFDFAELPRALVNDVVQKVLGFGR